MIATGMKTNRTRGWATSQSGVLMLEALIGILIFSLGILAMVGLQATAVHQTMEARHRTEASALASQIVSQMWLDRANLANYVYDGGGTPPAALTDWVNLLEASLPGVASNHPTIDVGSSVSLPSAVGTEVEVVVFWQNPGQPNRHQFTITAYIN